MQYMWVHGISTSNYMVYVNRCYMPFQARPYMSYSLVFLQVLLCAFVCVAFGNAAKLPLPDAKVPEVGGPVQG